MPSDIRNTDAFIQTPKSNPFAMFMQMQRMKDENRFRNMEMQMGLARLNQSQERLQQSEKKSGLDEFSKDLATLMASTKGLPGGKYYQPLQKKTSDLMDEMTNYYKKNNTMNQPYFLPKINKLVEDVNKDKVVNKIVDNEDKALGKKYVISDADGARKVLEASAYGTKGKDGKYSLTPIDDLDVDKVSKTISDNPDLLPYIDKNATFFKAIHDLPKIAINNSSGGGNALGSSLHAISTVMTKYMDIDPRTGQLRAYLPDNEEVRSAVGYGVDPNQKLINDPLYTFFKGNPGTNSLMNMAVAKVNESRPPDKQIPMDSPAADYIRKSFAYSNIVHLAGEKKTTRNTDRETKLAMQLKGQLPSDASMEAAQNVYGKVFKDIKEGNFDDLSKYGFTPLSTTGFQPLSPFGIVQKDGESYPKGKDVVPLTDFFNGHNVLGDSNTGKQNIISQAYAVKDKDGNGKIWVQYAPSDKPNDVKGRYLTDYEMQHLPVVMTKQTYGQKAANEAAQDNTGQEAGNNTNNSRQGAVKPKNNSTKKNRLARWLNFKR